MKALAIAASVFVIVILALFLFREPLLLAVGNFLVIQDELEPADVINLNGGPDHRADYAIQLYQKGLGRRIFFVGGSCSIHGNDALHGQARAIEQSVPEKNIFIDSSEVTSTYEEALELKEWINTSSLPIHSVIVVSDPFHMRRTRWAYRKVLGDDVEIQMAPVPFEKTPYKQQWWEDKSSQRFVKDEYEKLVYYFLRYQLSWKWLAFLDKE